MEHKKEVLLGTITIETWNITSYKKRFCSRRDRQYGTVSQFIMFVWFVLEDTKPKASGCFVNLKRELSSFAQLTDKNLKALCSERERHWTEASSQKRLDRLSVISPNNQREDILFGSSIIPFLSSSLLLLLLPSMAPEFACKLAQCEWRARWARAWGTAIMDSLSGNTGRRLRTQGGRRMEKQERNKEVERWIEPIKEIGNRKNCGAKGQIDRETEKQSNSTGVFWNPSISVPTSYSHSLFISRLNPRIIFPFHPVVWRQKVVIMGSCERYGASRSYHMDSSLEEAFNYRSHYRHSIVPTTGQGLNPARFPSSSEVTGTGPSRRGRA